MNEVATLDAPRRPFLLMERGPLFHIEERLKLIKGHAPFAKRRAMVAALVTWLLLFILSAMQGRAFGHAVPVPFLRDYSTYSRFLVALPLLLLAENVLGPRIAEAASHFITTGVVTKKNYQQFDEFVVRGLRARDSKVAEVVLVIVAYISSFVAFREMAVHVTTWYRTYTHGGATITWAGWWLILFCVPLYQFLMLRWLWRLFLWFRFLGRVRRLDLQLYPAHPDKAGGLGFVGEAQRYFGILLFAFSIGSVGVMANNILYDKEPLQNFVPAIVVYVIVALLIILGPLAVFSGTLIKLKREGLHEFGALATAYTGLFQKKWIRQQEPGDEPLLGTGDIQSLADLGNSYALVDKMKFIPIDPLVILHLIVASLVPLLPLLLTVMPLKDILKLLFKLLG